MSYSTLSPSLIERIISMGYSYSAIQLAQQATNSSDSDVLLDWILMHENEIYTHDVDRANENRIIEKMIELGFPRRSAELAQLKTNSNDVQTLADWIVEHSSSEEPCSLLVSSSPNRLNANSSAPKGNDKPEETLLQLLLKSGFDANDIEQCFRELNIDPRRKVHSTSKKTECFDWLINQNHTRAQLKAKQIDSSRLRQRFPPPIQFNNRQAINKSTSTTAPMTITNNFLRDVHLESRHPTTIDHDEQATPLTREEAIMLGIHENLKRHSWTIHNLDQLNLIQKHIKIVAKFIDEDRRNPRSSNENEDKQGSRPTSAREPTKKVFTLADIIEKDQSDHRPHVPRALERPPREFSAPGLSFELTSLETKDTFHLGALEEADWDLRSLAGVDRIAIEFQRQLGENYRQLADRLVAACPISTDRKSDIIRAIFVWITNHIRYDIDMSPRDNARDKTDEQMDELCREILNTQSCVCVGYAVLFKRMCEHFGIRVDYVTGYTKRTKSCINDTAGVGISEKLPGHAWAIVCWDGKTYFIDPTWSAAQWSLNRMVSPFTNTYYLVPPKNAIYQFRPHDDRHQHLSVPWNIAQFLQEPCFYPHYFRWNLTLLDRETEWYYYRLTIDRSKQTSLTKSFGIITTKSNNNSRYRLKMCGYMYWSKELDQLAGDLCRFDNTDHKHTLDAVEFKSMDLTYADGHLNDRTPKLIAELENIPIYPPKLDVYQIQYGLLKIFATDQDNGRYKPIFECIFEFH